MLKTIACRIRRVLTSLRRQLPAGRSPSFSPAPVTDYLSGRTAPSAPGAHWPRYRTAALAGIMEKTALPRLAHNLWRVHGHDGTWRPLRDCDRPAQHAKYCVPNRPYDKTP